MKKEKANQFENFKKLILDEYKKGNIVFMGVDEPLVCNLDKFLKQPIEGILYDLNRSEEVVLSFIEDPKWVNDYAVAKVIRRLKEMVEQK